MFELRLLFDAVAGVQGCRFDNAFGLIDRDFEPFLVNGNLGKLCCPGGRHVGKVHGSHDRDRGPGCFTMDERGGSSSQNAYDTPARPSYPQMRWLLIEICLSYTEGNSQNIKKLAL